MFYRRKEYNCVISVSYFISHSLFSPQLISYKRLQKIIVQFARIKLILVSDFILYFLWLLITFNLELNYIMCK